jgi:hypothetical protein
MISSGSIPCTEMEARRALSAELNPACLFADNFELLCNDSRWWWTQALMTRIHPRRLASPILVVLLVAFASVFARTADASAASYYKLSAYHSALVLDVAGGSTNARAGVVQWYDNGGSNQHWTVPLGLSGALGGSADGPIVNQRSGQCLTTDGVAGHQLFQYPCQTRADGSPVAGQQWRVENVNADGVLWHTTLIKSLDYGLVVDVSGYSYAPGAAVVAWQQGSAGAYYNYALNQVFNQARA